MWYPGWEKDGACDQTDPLDYFLADINPDEDSLPQDPVEREELLKWRQDRIMELTNNCRRNCPVMEICKNEALLHEEFGLWGGTSTRDRKRIRNNKRNEVIIPLMKQAMEEEWIKPALLVDLSKVYEDLTKPPEEDFDAKVQEAHKALEALYEDFFKIGSTDIPLPNF